MPPQEDNIQLPPVQPASQPDGTNQQVTDPVRQQNNDSANPLVSSVPQGAIPDAGDVDLIEKEWVEKAKIIVKGTMGDPHTQSEKISQMKADYIRQRFNKDISSEEK
jgi:hypothetical protein